MKMQESASSCRWDGRQRSQGPADTRAASCCGLLLGHPELESDALTARRGRRSAGHRAAPPPAPAGRPGARPHRRRGARRVRRGLPRAAARPVRRLSPSCRRTSWSSTSAPTSGWPTPPPGSVLRRPARRRPGRTACPSCPAPRAALAGSRRGSPSPGCYPTAVVLALAPGARRRAGRAGDVVVVAASGTSGAGKVAKPHLLGSEVMGSLSPYGVGGAHRHTPEMVQNLTAAAGAPVTCRSPRCWPRCPAASSPPAPPGAGRRHHRADAARRLRRRPTPTSRSCTSCPRAQWPRDRRHASAPTPSSSRSRSTSTPAGSSRSAPSTTSTKGTAGQARPEHQHRPRPARGPRTARRSESHRERHRRPGLPGGRRRRRDQGRAGSPDLALVVNDGPRAAAAGVFTSNRVKAAPVLWSEQVLRGRPASTPSSSTPAAPTPAPGRAGFQDTHATAEKVAEALGARRGDVAVCSTGLIGERLPMDSAAARRRRRGRRARRRRRRGRGRSPS